VGDLGRQIGDHARATAEASPRSTVGDVIQPGQPIPDDVTGVSDADDDTWTVTDGRWTCEATLESRLAARFKGWSADQLVAKHGPLTVTAVREQPAEPDIAHEAPVQPTCPAHGAHPHRIGATCLDCPICRPPAEPEPQQADEPALLDLVRQYGNALSRSYGLPSAASMGLLARIAALVPQQPDLMAQVMAELGVDKPEDAPLAVKADRDALTALRAIRKELIRDRDEARAEVERLTESIESQIAAKESWIGATEKIKDVVTRPLCLLLGVHHNEAIVPAVERLKAAQPDPMVLRLPEVPEGTVLTGMDTGNRYLPRRGGVWAIEYHEEECGDLHWVLRREDVRVELAPPREPRTPAEIWAGLSRIQRDVLLADNVLLTELAEALDREAGR
jgi:hypothetical protein